MRFTRSWLNEFLHSDVSTDVIAQTLTSLGLEVEQLSNPADSIRGFSIAKIISAKPHPDADKLQVCQVLTAEGEKQIVCGAPNARAGLYVVLAPIGAVIPSNGLVIKVSKIRGVESNGMLCSASELGLGDDSAGIIEVVASDNEIGMPYVDVVGLDDPVIEIAITPDRADCLGVYGIARDLAAAGLGTLKPLTIPVIKAKDKPAFKVVIDSQLCTQFQARVIKGVTNRMSPQWLRQRLTSIGFKPVSALVDITNYLSYSFARPLHVYDAACIQGNLNVRYAKKGEVFEALDRKAYTLNEQIAVVADDKQVQAIAGVIGGLASACTDATTDIIVEVARFSEGVVAHSGRALDINTDSRYRFERGVDPLFLDAAMALATQLILELCGGKVSEIVTTGSANYEAVQIDFNASNIEALTGLSLETKEVKTILTNLGYEVNKSYVVPPSWRADVQVMADVVADVVRVKGYQHIPMVPLAKTFPLAVSPLQARIQAAHTRLIEAGMMEVVTWSFMSSVKASLFGKTEAAVKLQNPISNELDCMRMSIIPNLLEAVARNAARGNTHLNLFEVGPVYQSMALDGQKLHISGIRAGELISRNIHQPVQKVDIFHAKADLLACLEAMSIPVASLRIEAIAPAYYHPGRSGVVKLGKEILGVFGQIHPAIAASYDIAIPVAGFECFVDSLPEAKQKAKAGLARKALHVSDYQASVRDFAFVLDCNVTAEVLLNAINRSDKQLIEQVELFDVYEGPHVPIGKKSVAVSVSLRAFDRTLTDQDIEAVSQQIIQSVRTLGGALR